MEAVKLSEAQFPQWDAFVTSHSNGTIYHGSEWKRALESAFSHIKGQFIAIIDPRKSSIVAGIPIYQVKSGILGTRLVCVPYSTWCDPLYPEADHLAVLLEKVRELAKSTKAKSVDIRCRKGMNVPKSTQEYSLNPASMHHWIDLKPGLEEIRKNLHLTSIRQMIGRAVKGGVALSSHSDDASLQAFYTCLIDTRKRLGLPMIPYEYFASLHDSISKGSLRMLLAQNESQTLGAGLLLLKNGICHLEFTGERRKMKAPGALPLIIWEAIRIARAEGCTEFSFGRTTFDNQGLIRYKRRWNSNEELIQTLSLNDPKNRKSIPSSSIVKSIVKFINRKSPKRFYIFLGSFLYRHWG